MQSTVGTRAFW